MIARVLVFVLGLMIVLFTLIPAIRTFVLPRSDNVFLTRLILQIIFRLFLLRLYWADTYAERDRVMALFSPISLVMMPIVWLTSVTIGYMGMFWALGVQPWYDAFLLSGSSLLTLGFAPVNGLAQTILAFSEATLGLALGLHSTLKTA